MTTFSKLYVFLFALLGLQALLGFQVLSGFLVSLDHQTANFSPFRSLWSKKPLGHKNTAYFPNSLDKTISEIRRLIYRRDYFFLPFSIVVVKPCLCCQ